MSFPDAFAHDIVLGPDQVLPTVPRDFGERFTLNWKAARAPDKSYFYETRMSELWDDALDQLQKATGQTFPNPFTLAPAQSVAKLSPAGMVIDTLQRTLFGDRQKGVDAALKAFDQAREGQFDLPDPRRFEDRVRAESVKLRQDAERSALASYGAGGLGAFIGAAAGELSHPVNIATLPLGGEYAIANVARMGLLKFLGRNALLEGGVAAVSQTAIEVMDAPIQERLATDTGIGDRVERILTAGVGGAALGLGISGLVAAVRGARFRGRMTLDEGDALKVAERASYAERNPLGPEGINAHAKALDAAEVQVSAGRHAEVREIVAQDLRRQVKANEPKAGDRVFLLNDKGEPAAQPAIVEAVVDGGTGRFVIARDAEGALLPPHRLEETRPADMAGAPAPARGASEILSRSAEETVPPVSETKLIREPHSLETTASWVIREKATKKALFETFNPAIPKRLNTDKYEAVPILDYLGSLNHSIKSGGSEHAFDILDSASATRPIADAAPVPPEKPPTGMKEAKADEARAMVMQKDFDVHMGTNDNGEPIYKKASEIMAEADERLKAAKLAAECAAGGAIG